MELLINTRLKVCFENEETEKAFVKRYKASWKGCIKKNFLRQPEGVWEIFHAANHSGSYIFGSIGVDDEGWFYAKPKSGLCRKKHLEQVRPQFVRHIIKRITEIFGESGNDGSDEAYAWLYNMYGITEEEDNRWTDILLDGLGELTADSLSSEGIDESEQTKILNFVKDEESSVSFLLSLMEKYDRMDGKYPARSNRSSKKSPNL
jgi:hypothetical protein